MTITSEQLTPWQRRLVPGLTDLLFAVLLFSLLNRRLFNDGDTGWHLWAGMETLAHGPRAIPDTLSFTRAGVPWRDVSWLADAVFALLYRHAGYFGVAALVTLLFAGLFTWLYRILLRETGHVPAAITATGLAALVGVIQLLARPVVFSLVLVLAVWELVRVPGRERLALWLLPPLTALWANVHPMVFIAPGLAIVGWLTRGRDRRLALASLLSLAALGATPWGFGWLRDMVPTGDNLLLFKNIDEWQTPRFSDLRYRSLFAYLLLALAVRCRGPRLAWGEMLMGLACLAGSLLAVRIGPIAAILWAPLLARDLAGRNREDNNEGRSRGWILGRFWRAAQESLVPFERVLRPGLWPALIIVLMLAFAPQWSRAFPGVSEGFPAKSFPHRATVVADSLQLGPRVLNHFGWGGYVSWVYGGRWKVFIDGRAGFYGGEPLADFIKLWMLSPGWEGVLERRRVDWMLLQQESPLVVAAPLTGRWRVAYRDSLAAILTPVPSPGPAR
jgi:hypothetical protein